LFTTTAGGTPSFFLTTPTEAERLSAIGEALHFGLFITHDGEKMLLVPVYSKDGVIVAIQFRTAGNLVDAQIAQFEKLLNASRALCDFYTDPDIIRIREKT
jgi:hypothetical protein